MKTYKAKNGRPFRLSGLEIRHEVDFLKILWLDTNEFEEFVFQQVEPILLIDYVAISTPSDKKTGSAKKSVVLDATETKPKDVKPKAKSVAKAVIKNEPKLQQSLL